MKRDCCLPFRKFWFMYYKSMDESADCNCWCSSAKKMNACRKEQWSQLYDLWILQAEEQSEPLEFYMCNMVTRDSQDLYRSKVLFFPGADVWNDQHEDGDIFSAGLGNNNTGPSKKIWPATAVVYLPNSGGPPKPLHFTLRMVSHKQRSLAGLKEDKAQRRVFQQIG